MSDIGVRELKTRASEIIRKVKEEGERYIITYRGRPVAAIVPVDDAQAESNAQAGILAWDELVQLGQQISQEWNSPQTSAEILSEMRR